MSNQNNIMTVPNCNRLEFYMIDYVGLQGKTIVEGVMYCHLGKFEFSDVVPTTIQKDPRAISEYLKDRLEEEIAYREEQLGLARCLPGG